MHKKLIAIAYIVFSSELYSALEKELPSAKKHLDKITTAIKEAKAFKEQNKYVFHGPSIVHQAIILEKIVSDHPCTQDFSWSIEAVVAKTALSFLPTYRLDNAISVAETAAEHLRNQL